MEILEERIGVEQETTATEISTASESQGTKTTVAAVPSPASSPSHEFSFTVSLHSAATTTPPSPTLSTRTTKEQHHQQQQHHNRQLPLAIDLTPADDIFFHGHLLPLHFLSHLHASTSPRSSTNSLDSFTLPMREIIHEDKPATNSFSEHRTTHPAAAGYIGSHCSKEGQNKSKSFSLSGLSKWIKGSESKSDKRKQKFDVGQFVKRYVKMVKPLLSPRGGKRDDNHFRGRGREHQSYSFSGSLTPRASKKELRNLRGEYSAPASMRTSPTNSGLLLATAAVPYSPVSDSTMEELQAAIQAAIAHCKKSSSSSSSSSDHKTQDQVPPSLVPVN